MNDASTDIQRTGKRMAWLAALALLGVLWLVFDGALDRRDNPNAQLAVTPGAATELVLQRNRQGHYVAPGEINGAPVTFLLDTGATLVSVPAHLADALQLQRGMAGQSMTANGTVTVYATRIDSLALGPFVVRDVAGALNPGMRDDIVLLGMSVLKNLEFTQRGDTLILRPHS
jgi:aspartyl protease family protein